MKVYTLNEVWQDIPNMEGYQASNRGRIKSLDRVCTAVVKGKAIARNLKGRILKPVNHIDGYHLVNFSVAGNTGLATVHSLVARAFLGIRPRGLLVLHHDDHKTNNRIENLRYGTYKDNGNDAKRNRILRNKSKVYSTNN